MMPQRPMNPATPPKFPRGAFVRHTNGDQYVIIFVPGDIRLERTWEPGYAYRAIQRLPVAYVNLSEEMIIRCQTEMEDGRFTLVT